MGEIAHTCPTEFFFDGQSKQTQLAELWPQMSRENIGAIDLRGEGRYLLLAKPTHGFPEHVDGFAQTKIEFRKFIRHDKR